MQPDFNIPDFLKNNSADEIHQRMMNNLPGDIDDMPGGFPYDFTMPAALEKEEFINYHLVRTIMIAFPQYAWDDWLDMHGRQVHLVRHPPQKAYGSVSVSGIADTAIPSGTVFCTSATDTGPSIEFVTLENAEIGESGEVSVQVQAVQAGSGSNVAANTVTMMAKPDKGVMSVNNPEPINGGTDRESNDDFYDRIAAEYDNSMTYIGNDADYIRWAMQAGAGGCIVVPAAEGPGTVKLVLVDGNGQPANDKLVQDVHDYIISPDDRSARLLPTACAKLICAPATTIEISYTITGLVYDQTTDIGQIKEDFGMAVKEVYGKAKGNSILRYNDVRPLIKDIAGVLDFEEFLMNNGTENIRLKSEEYPETGTLDFS
jgi:uncharacterized phage protein gp47/JayE